jgi:hypothetical protein
MLSRETEARIHHEVHPLEAIAMGNCLLAGTISRGEDIARGSPEEMTDCDDPPPVEVPARTEGGQRPDRVMIRQFWAKRGWISRGSKGL